MYQSNYYMSLDIRDSHGTSCPEMNLGDTERKLYIHLTDGGRPYTLAPGCFPVFTAKKPDGAVIFNACQVENNMVVYRVTPQTTACAGVLQCQLRLYDGDPEKSAQLLTSARFGIRVHPTVYNEGDIPESQGEVGALTKLIGDAIAATEAAEAAAEKVENIIDDRTTTPEKTWSSQKVSDLFTNTATRLEALMDAKDQQVALEMEMKMAADGVNASTLKLGNDTSSAVVVSADSREDGFGVLRLDPFMKKPFPERDKNRVILRNISPGLDSTDAVNLGQLQEKVNETKPIIVTLFNDENSASHTAKEIKAFSNDGRPVFGAVFSNEIGEYTGELLNLSSVSNNAACFSSVTVFEQYAREDKYIVDENGFFQYDYTITNNVTKEQLDYAVENLVTKEQFNGAVGDMETALDAIIAIQKELLRFVFYIDESEFVAEAGMTWREWIDSEYNDGRAYVGFLEDGDVAFEFVVFDDTDLLLNDNRVYPDDRIIADATYTW